jgi:hypothetical protein
MVLFFAFSLQDQVEKYGAYVGIAAFFGLAVLSVLYFSQARELRRLRDWAGRAPERAQELEARVTANAQAARSVQAVPRAATPAAAAAVGAAAPQAAAAGTATQVVEPEAEKAVAAGGNGAQAGPVARPEGPVTADGAKPAAPEAEPVAGDEAKPAADEAKPEAEGAAAEEPKPVAEGPEPKPAVEGAEATESKPAEEPKPAAGEAAPVPAPAQAGNGAPPDADSEQPEAPPVPAPAQAGNGPVQPLGPEVAPIPRATPVPRRAPAPAAALRQPSRSATLPPRRPTPAPAPPRDEGGHRWILPVVLGVVVLAAAVFSATQLLGGDDNPAPRTPSADQPAETPDGGDGTTQAPSEGSLTPETAKVAVLNGTTVEGLASNQADTLKGAGYKGEITTGNNTEQRVESTVLYGDGARTLARDVARRLSIAGVGRLDADTRALGEDADIVVILGQDKAP